MSKSGKKDKPASDTKGRLVERIAAWLYEATGVTVEKRAFVPTLDGEGDREIDVLLTDTRGIYPVRFAVECKNEGKPIGVDRIGIFADKLAEIGIPPQHGIYVSVSRYTKDALRRAKKLGIRPLVLSNLTKDRLAAEVSQAFQSLVFVRARVERINWLDDSDTAVTDTQEYQLYDVEGRAAGTFPDYVWHWWINRETVAEIGRWMVDLNLPEGFHRIVNGERCALHKVGVTLMVEGMIFTFSGQHRQHSVTNASTNELDRFRMEASFPMPPQGQHVLRTITNPHDLDEYVRGLGGPHILQFIPLPRIQIGAIYWPPSERVASMLRKQEQAESEGQGESSPLDFDKVEGRDVNVAWEPVWSEYFQAEP